MTTCDFFLSPKLKGKTYDNVETREHNVNSTAVGDLKNQVLEILPELARTTQ
jgi:hypothetical protein